MGSLRPSQVRNRILREHASIQVQLGALAKLSARLITGQIDVLREAQQKFQSFYRDLRDHIDFEDALLVPALAESDAWGSVRAQQLTSHHAAQREQLQSLAARSDSEPPEGLGRMLVSLIDELRADMSAEEREFLSSDLLRDDLIVDAEDG